MAKLYSVSRLIDNGSKQCSKTPEIWTSDFQFSNHVNNNQDMNNHAIQAHGKRKERNVPFMEHIASGLSIQQGMSNDTSELHGNTDLNEYNRQDETSINNGINKHSSEHVSENGVNASLFTLSYTSNDEPDTSAHINNEANIRFIDEICLELDDKETSCHYSTNGKKSTKSNWQLSTKRNISETTSDHSNFSKCNSIPDINFSEAIFASVSGKNERRKRQSFADVVTEVIQGPIKEDLHPFGRGHLYGNAINGSQPKLRRDEGQLFMWALVTIILLGFVTGIILMSQMYHRQQIEDALAANLTVSDTVTSTYR